MRPTRGSVSAVVAVVGGLLFCAPPAFSFVVIGQTTGTPTPDCGRTFVQATAVPPGYEVPAPGGVITSVMTSAGDSPGDVASFKIVVPTTATMGGSGTVYKVIGSVGPEILTPNALSTFPARVPVPAGATLALWSPDMETANCAFTTGSSTDEVKWSNTDPADPGVGVALGDNPQGLKGLPQQRINMAAVVEPDADGDGFGDETEDNCVGKAGADAGCPPPSKCKKKKKKHKHRDATAAKKHKKCKKKKKGK